MINIRRKSPKWIIANFSWFAVQATMAICLLIIVSLPAFAAIKAPTKPEITHPKIPITTDPRLQKAPCVNIQIKFDDKWTVRLKDVEFVSKPAFSKVTEALLLSVPTPKWLRLIDSVNVAALDELRQKAQALSGRKLADMNNYYLACVAPDEVTSTLKMLKGRLTPEIQFALELPYGQSPPAIPNFFVDPESDPLDLNPTAFFQRYLFGTDQGGIDAVGVWGLDGGRGAGVSVTDVEYDFNPEHIDLVDKVEVVGDPLPIKEGGDHEWHGTASLSIIGGTDNNVDDKGVSGIASEAALRFSSVEVYPSGQVNIPDALVDASPGILTGDVMVIEQQIIGPKHEAHVNTYGKGTQRGLAPAEWDPAVFDTIQLLSSLGVVVVEAAGNGSEDLDADYFVNDLDHAHAPFVPGNDSGAILVGAGWPSQIETKKGNGPAGRMHMTSSNYGQRLDLQGWGVGVVSAGYGDLYNAEGDDASYHLYGGTSSATAIVAGVVASLQGIFMADKGRPATPDELKFLLKVSGQPQVEPNGKRIGPLPDLRWAANLLRNSNFLPVPVFTCSNCADSEVSSSEFHPPRFEPAPSYESSTTKLVQLQVPRGINPDHVTIAYTLDGTEPETENSFQGLPGEEVMVAPEQRLRAKTLLDYQFGPPPSWAATESQAVPPLFAGAPPLRPGEQIFLMPGGNQGLETTLTLFTINGDVPDPEGLGYSEGGGGFEVGPDGLAWTISHPIRIIARSYMRGFCSPDAEDSVDWECAPGERPTSRLVTAAYSVVDGTVPAPVIMDSGDVGIDQAEALGLNELEIWYTTDTAQEPYPQGPGARQYNEEAIDLISGSTINARAYAFTGDNSIKSASEVVTLNIP